MLKLAVAMFFFSSIYAWTDQPAFKTCLRVGSGGVNLTCSYHPVFNPDSKPLIQFEGAYCGQVAGGAKCDVGSSEAGNCVGSARMNLTFWNFCNERSSCFLPEDQVMHYCEFSECGSNSLLVWHSCIENRAVYTYDPTDFAPLAIRPKYEPVSYPELTVDHDADRFTDCLPGHRVDTNFYVKSDGTVYLKCGPTANSGRRCVGRRTTIHCEDFLPYGVRLIRVPYGDVYGYCNIPSDLCQGRDYYYVYHQCNRARNCHINADLGHHMIAVGTVADKWRHATTLTRYAPWALDGQMAHFRHAQCRGLEPTRGGFRPSTTYMHVVHRCNLHMFEPMVDCSSRSYYASYQIQGWSIERAKNADVPHFSYIAPRQKFNYYEHPGTPIRDYQNLLWHSSNYREGSIKLPAHNLVDVERKKYPVHKGSHLHVLEASRLHSWPCLTESYRTTDSCLHLDALKSARAVGESLGFGERTGHYHTQPYFTTVDAEYDNAGNLIQTCGYAAKFCLPPTEMRAYVEHEKGYGYTMYNTMKGFFNPKFVAKRYWPYSTEFDNRIPFLSLTFNFGSPCYRNPDDCAAAIIWDPSGGCDLTVYPSKTPFRAYEDRNDYGSTEAFTNVVAVYPDNYRAFSNASTLYTAHGFFDESDVFYNHTVPCASNVPRENCRESFCTGRNLMHFRPSAEFPQPLPYALTMKWRTTFNDDLWCDNYPSLKNKAAPCHNPAFWQNECYEGSGCDGVTSVCRPVPDYTPCESALNTQNAGTASNKVCIGGTCIFPYVDGEPCVDESEVPGPCSDTSDTQRWRQGECLYPLKPAGTKCRDERECEAEAYCNGVNIYCLDTYRNYTSICAQVGCDIARCSGVNENCPFIFEQAPDETPCAVTDATPDPESCEVTLGSCQAGTCISGMQVLLTGNQCYLNDQCRSSAFCDGENPTCPFLPKPDGTNCTMDGLVTDECTQVACSNGVCQVVAKAENTPCNITDVGPCSEGRCLSGVCTTSFIGASTMCNSSNGCYNDIYCGGSFSSCPQVTGFYPDNTACTQTPAKEDLCLNPNVAKCKNGYCVNDFLPAGTPCGLDNAITYFNEATCTGSSPTCPIPPLRECIYPEIAFGDSCYFFAANIRLNWPNSEASCKLWGGDIIAIDTKMENDFVVDHMLSNYNIDSFWVGLSSVEIFEWSTEDENANKDHIEPDIFPIHCVYSHAPDEVNGEPVWLNDNCRVEKAFICERGFIGNDEPPSAAYLTANDVALSGNLTGQAIPPIGWTLPATVTAGVETPWIISTYDAERAADLTYVPEIGYPPHVASNNVSRIQDPHDTAATSSCAQIWSARLGVDFDGAASYASIEDKIHPTCIIKPNDSIKFKEREHARTWCKNNTNGHLVAIQSVGKFNFINGQPYGNTQDKPLIGAYNTSNDYWIGLQRRLKYMWNNGNVNSDLMFTPIGAIAGLKNCFFAGSDNGKWHENECVSEKEIGFLCETSACPSGYRSQLYYDEVFKSNIFGCFEYDACLEAHICGPSSAGQCVRSNVRDNGLAYTCKCSTGYENRGGSVQGLCVDINECDALDGVCGDSGICQNFDGIYLCECYAGKVFDQELEKCVDVNECDVNPNICEFGTCTNTVGSYTCDCDHGFVFLDGRCHDIEECAENVNVCGSGSLQCVNVNGFNSSAGAPFGYKCICNVGYAFNGIICVDVDECKHYENYCGDTLATCVNEIGFAACTCPSANGYYLLFDYATHLCGPANTRQEYLESLWNMNITRRKRKTQQPLYRSYNEPGNIRFMRVLLEKR